MQKQIFIQNSHNKDVYFNVNQLVKVVKVQSGIFDLYFKDGSTSRVSSLKQGQNILDAIELLNIG